MHYLDEFKDELDVEAIKRAIEEQFVRVSKGREQNFMPSLDLPVNNDFSQDFVEIGKSNLTKEQSDHILAQMDELIPWRKGPFKIHGLPLDAEWRSDFKWNRLKQQLTPLKDRKVLDVGCNNGYYMFRMLDQDPRFVLGIDPSMHTKAQFDFLQSYARDTRIHYEVLGIEHLGLFKNFFDTIFCMGIIYHHRHPIEQMLSLKDALVPGGEAIVETIGIPGDKSYALFPEDRYANMKNIWFIPTLSCFMNWARKSKFKKVELISDTLLTFDEQRNTKYCPPPHPSLKDFLDPKDASLTVEGHPAPRRFCIKITK